MELNLPTGFCREIIRWTGKKGEQWLKELPELLEACADKWNLEIGQAVPNLSVTYVTNAKIRNGEEVMLKMIPYGEPLHEMEALEHLRNHAGVVNLIYSDHELSAMVLEKISPGTSLREIQKEDDEKAMEIAAPIIRDAMDNVPLKHQLKTMEEEMSVIRKVYEEGKGDKETRKMFKKAIALLNELESIKGEDKLIHADLHHDNILLDQQRGWLAIDPKGRIGDPVYNAARIMRNYWDTIPKEPIVKKRIDILADTLGYSKKRIASWAYLDCILSDAWDLDDFGEQGEQNKTIIPLLETMI